MATALTLIRVLLVSACLHLAVSASALDPQLRFWQYSFSTPPAESYLDGDVLDVAQSADGFLWLATGRGLIRYDGYDVIVYRTASHPGLMTNQPTGVFATSDDQLLVTSLSGVSRYDGRVFRPLLSGNKWAANVHAIAEDQRGTLWFASEKGLWSLRGDTFDTERYAGQVSQVSALVVRGDTLYAGGQGVVFEINGDEVIERPLPIALAKHRVRDLAVHQKQIYGATHRGMFRLTEQGIEHLDHELVADLHVELLLSDRDENLWFGGERAVGRFFPNGEIELPNVEDEALGFVPQLSAMLEDNQGQVWHSSLFFGLTALRDTVVRRVSFTEGLHSPHVAAVTRDAIGKVYVATDKGISVLTDTSITSVVKEDFARNGKVHTLLVDDDEQLWVGTQTGLRRFDLHTGTWRESPAQQRLQLPVNALAMAAGMDNDLWVATDLGLHKITDGNVDTVFDAAQTAIESLYLARNGRLWLGTESGLASLEGNQLARHATDLPGANTVVTSILERPNGQIIAATASNGIVVETDGRWRRFGETEGLPPERLIDIELRGDYLWLITSAGVFRTPVDALDEAQSELTVQPIATHERYRSLHGIYCCNGRNSSAALQSNGVLVAATEDGVITYDLDAVGGAHRAPRPYIKSLTVGTASYAVDDAARPDVSADDNRLRIDYSAIDLVRGAQLEFRYRLRGINDEWIDVGRVRSVQLQGLPPGEFAFELQASSAPGLWSESGISVGFRRTARFTETMMFRTVLWCGSVVLVLALIWLRSANARRRHHHLEQRIKKRTHTLRELNDELADKNEHLKRASETDALTGLYNRRYFDARRDDRDLAQSMRQQGLLIILDIDHFKNVNDTHGHPAGDEVLRQFADVLRSATRQSDLVARWGGEEFMLLCRCSAGDAPNLLERVIRSVREHPFVLPNGTRLPITCSLGSVRFPMWDGHDLSDQLAILLELGDAALYCVKSQGRDGWVMLEGDKRPAMNIKVRHAGPMLAQLVDSGHLRWHASRPEIAAPAAESMPKTGSLG
ncbi:MAG: diguanylate cyclase [Gammaproteobacteria bacterium]